MCRDDRNRPSIILNNQYLSWGRLTKYSFIKTPNSKASARWRKYTSQQIALVKSFHRICHSRRYYAPIARRATSGLPRKWKAEVRSFRSLLPFLPFLHRREDSFSTASISSTRWLRERHLAPRRREILFTIPGFGHLENEISHAF